MLRYGLTAISRPSPVRASARPARGWRLSRDEGDARRRPEQVCATVAAAGLERVRPGDLLLAEFGAPVGRCDVDAVGRHDPALVHRVLVRVSERDQPAVADERRGVETGDQVDRGEGDLERLGQRAAQGGDLAPAERPREATDPDRDRVDRPATDQLDELVAGLLEGQPRFDGGPVILGELERAGVAEEVGQVEQVDVERVALDPLAAVEQAAERADGGVDLDPETVLEGMDRGHLVGDRADPADAGDDVDDLVRRPPDDEALEVARRLEDLEVGFLDHAVVDAQPERSLALDPGQSGDVDGEVAVLGRQPFRCSSSSGRPWSWAPRRAVRAGRRGCR